MTLPLNTKQQKNPRKLGFQSGVTLLEVILVLTIGVAVATMVTLVTSAGLKNIRSAKRLERLHANAVFTTNALTYWIKQGDLLTVTSTTALRIILPDSSIKYIEKSNNRVTLDGNAITTDDAQVTNLTFARFGRSVRFGLSLKARNAPETLSVTSTVAQRNSF
ncbi:MAG: hypothetical protein Q7S09_03895 [bacterium]|nr:hypothetical protein [bacterium]